MGQCLRMTFSPKQYFMHKHLSILLLLPTLVARAQWGIQVGTSVNSTPSWQAVTEYFVAHKHFDLMKHGTYIVVDYSKEQVGRRFRFQPAIRVSKATSWRSSHYFEASALGIQGNISMSLWPSVQDNGKPAPFTPILQLSSGLDLLGLQMERPTEGNNERETFRKKDIALHIGASLLIEFQLTKTLSLSPLAGLVYFPKVEWRGFSERLSKGTWGNRFDETSLQQIVFGCRMGLTFGNKKTTY